MSVRIDRLRIRAAGLTPEQARRLGETVARRLADAPPVPNRSERVPAVSVRTRAKQSIDALADDIAAQIRRKVGGK